MPLRFRFEDTIANWFEAFRRQIVSLPLHLGGVAGSGGGIGGPPGGFSGKLPQSRVTYDITEAVSSGIPDPLYSGSLVDNLNRIRYRLHVIESGLIHTYGENVTSQIPAVSDIFNLDLPYTSGTLNIYYNGIRQNRTYYTENHIGGIFVTNFSPISGDELFVDYVVEDFTE